MDDVVDLSMSIGGREAVSLSTATVRDLRALTQNAGLTITPAPPSAVTNGMYFTPNWLFITVYCVRFCDSLCVDSFYHHTHTHTNHLLDIGGKSIGVIKHCACFLLFFHI